MKKLLLVYPKCPGLGFGETPSLGCPPIALGYVAALTPRDWDVTIVDEYRETLDMNEDADLVGISVMTSSAPRAYEISRAFRSRNIKVILGGIHVSMCPDEALRFADAVVIGEVENVWAKVLSDLGTNQLSGVYQGPRPSLDSIPIPRRDLLRKEYPLDAIQTSRGCPFSCEFCSVTAYQGSAFRQRSAESVVDELEQIEGDSVFFTDDNFFGSSREHIERAAGICRLIIDRKIRKQWITQTSVDIARYEDVLGTARRAGCRGLFIGIETVEPRNWDDMKKRSNQRVGLAGVRDAVRRIHAHGILVVAPFIFGSDSDTIDVFSRTTGFIAKEGIDVPLLAMLTPFPGTEFYRRLERDGRIIHKNFPEDWGLYDVEHACHLPGKLSPTDLTRGLDYSINRIYSRSMLLRMAFRTLVNTRSFSASMMALKLNLDIRTGNNEKRIGVFRPASGRAKA